MNHFLRYQAPAILWAVVIFILSSFEMSVFPRITIPQADKIVHIILFCVLALLLERALHYQGVSLIISDWSAVWAFSISFLYGISDEFHQMFVPSRTADPADAAADLIGGFLFALIYWVVVRTTRNKVRS